MSKMKIHAHGRSSPAAQNWPLSCSVGGASFLARLLDGPSACSRAACSSLRHTSLALHRIHRHATVVVQQQAYSPMQATSQQPLALT